MVVSFNNYSRGRFVRKLLLILLFGIGFAVPFHANADERQEIIQRCRATMGEYGASIVKACADQDIEALAALQSDSIYSQYSSVVQRCMRQMKEYGYVIVKACADQDIRAEEELDNY